MPASEYSEVAADELGVNRDTLVVFLHGIEGGITGDKSRYFKRHYLETGNVLVPEMYMSVYRPDKRNSIMNCLLWRTPLIPLILALNVYMVSIYNLNTRAGVYGYVGSEYFVYSNTIFVPMIMT